MSRLTNIFTAHPSGYNALRCSLSWTLDTLKERSNAGVLERGLGRISLLSTKSGAIRLILVVLVPILFVGCGQARATQSPGATFREETVTLPTSLPTIEPSPISTRVIPLQPLTPEATPTITPIPDEVRGVVVKIIDGDTIAVVLEGDPPGLAYEVKYIGIDAPPNTPDDPWGVVAYETNRRMARLKGVRLERDETELDDEGRLLRYVYVNDQLMSIILAEQGLARADISEPNTRYQDEIEEAVSRARQARLGLWGDAPTTTPTRGTPTTEAENDAAEETDSAAETPTPTTSPPAATTTAETTPAPEETAESSTGTPTPAESEEAETATPSPENPASPDPTTEQTPEAEATSAELQ